MHFRYLSIKRAPSGSSCGWRLMANMGSSDLLHSRLHRVCPACQPVWVCDLAALPQYSQVHGTLYKASCLGNTSAFSLFYILHLFYILIFLTFCPLCLVNLSLDITARILRAASSQSLEGLLLSELTSIGRNPEKQSECRALKCSCDYGSSLKITWVLVQNAILCV